MTIGHLEPQKCGLLIVDIQDRMMRVIPETEQVVRNAVLLLKTAKSLGMPVVATTQYVARIGPLLDEVATEMAGVVPIDKLEFGCFYNAAARARLQSFPDITTWICCGVETHICMYQTVLGGLDCGYSMWIPADAVYSRTQLNYETGLERIREIGGVVGNTEMIIYELLHRAGTPEFKELLPFLK